MTTPIKPMSAEEIVEMMIDFASIGSDGNLYYHTDKVRSALASHLAYVKERMPEEWRWAHGDDCSHYENKCDVKDGSLEYNEALNACRAVLQSEIDELTKEL